MKNNINKSNTAVKVRKVSVRCAENKPVKTTAKNSNDVRSRKIVKTLKVKVAEQPTKMSNSINDEAASKLSLPSEKTDDIKEANNIVAEKGNPSDYQKMTGMNSRNCESNNSSAPQYVSNNKNNPLMNILNMGVGESIELIKNKSECKFVGDGNFYVDRNGVLLKYCGFLSELIIPSGITAIGKCVFSMNTRLKKVTLPDTLQYIDTKAFESCTELEEIVFPKYLKSLGDNAFFKCIKLRKIELNDMVTSIGNGCFAKCNGIEEISIPGSVLRIGSLSFYSCKNLRKVVFSDGTLSIGENAFNECYNLKNIILSNTITTIEDSAFSWCPNLENIELPPSVKSIGSCILFGCNNLKKISISMNVRNIKKDAFFGCESLKDLNILELNEPDLHKSDIKKAHRYAYRIIKQINESRAARYAKEHNI